MELEREKTSDDYLVDLLPESGNSTVSLMNGFPIYTCILVPRLSDYSLTSKYSRALKDAMNQLSQAFGWELDNLIVQPTYMRWTVKVHLKFHRVLLSEKYVSSHRTDYSQNSLNCQK